MIHSDWTNYRRSLWITERVFKPKKNVGNHWKHWVSEISVDLVNTKYRKHHRLSSDEIVVIHQSSKVYLSAALFFFEEDIDAPMARPNAMPKPTLPVANPNATPIAIPAPSIFVCFFINLSHFWNTSVDMNIILNHRTMTIIGNQKVRFWDNK